MIFLNTIKFLIPEFFLSTIILILIIFGVCYTRFQYLYKYFNGLDNILFLSIFSSIIAFYLYYNHFNCDFYILNFHYVGNRYTHLFKTSILFFTFCIFTVIKFTKGFNNSFQFEHIVLLFLAILGILLVISANDFIFFYLAIELQSLCLYVLAASQKYSNKSIEGGFKYFVIGSLFSGLLLLGICFLYGITGCTNITEIFIHMNNNLFSLFFIENTLLLSVSFILIFIPLFFKLSIAPFHSWTPDVYEGSSYIVLLFFNTIPKIGIVSVVLKFIFFLHTFQYSNILLIIFTFSGCLSLFVGSLAALAQTNVKRLIAYSTVANMGLVLISLGLNSYIGYTSTIFYIYSYVLLIFGVLLSFIRCHRKGLIVKLIPDNIGELTTLFKFSPNDTLLLTFNLFSLIGVPPLLGFFSKYFLLYAIISTNFWVIAYFVVLIGVYSCVYYLRIIKTMYFETPNIWTIYNNNSSYIGLLSFFLLFFNIFSFFMFDFYVRICQNVVTDMFLFWFN